MLGNCIKMLYCCIILSTVNILMLQHNLVSPLNEFLSPFFFLTTAGKIVYHVSSGVNRNPTGRESVYKEVKNDGK